MSDVYKQFSEEGVFEVKQQNEGFLHSAQLDRFSENSHDVISAKTKKSKEAKKTKVKSDKENDTLNTIMDAMNYCKKLVNIQINKAEDCNAPINESIIGDSVTRKAITILLPSSFIRTLFIETYSNRKAWPRIRPLFGLPPYSFLRPEDAEQIRASGCLLYTSPSPRDS